MDAAAFELAEHLRDRELTVSQLRASAGDTARTEKYEAQLARIDHRIAELRAAAGGGE